MSDDSELEAARIEAVRRYDILDTPPDGAFDRLTALAARLCGTRMAVVSIVDTDRIWFKSHHGLDITEIGRDPGLCASAILQDDPWVVEDAQGDPRTLANPLVAGELGLGFYLGIPLKTREGFGLGTLCVLDKQPRRARDRQIADLTDLAAVVMDELELRLSAQQKVATETSDRRAAQDITRALQETLLPASLPELDRVTLAARYVPANHERVGGDFYDALSTDAGTLLLVGDVAGHGPEAAALTSLARHTMLALASGDWTPASSLRALNRAVRRQQADLATSRFCTAAAVRIDRTDLGWAGTVSLGGHPNPLHVHADGTVEEIGSSGPLLGWLDEPKYHDARIDLKPGDSLVLYTDGLTDAQPGVPTIANGALMRSLGEHARGTADAIADALLESATASVLPPRDDIALLIAKFD